jgi:hypothetical protein
MRTPRDHTLTRRDFLRRTTGAAGAVMILQAGLARSYAANEKVSIGIIGAGGRGHANTNGVAGENIVALCDIDRGALNHALRAHPGARAYTDFREMLSQEKRLDAVVVSTPDNTHAVASLMAMKKGLHCYCEKPLTHDVYEARQMARVAAEKNLATQMGTPVPGRETTIRMVELLRAGVIGGVVEVHMWNDRPIWPQGFDRPPGEDPLPEHVDWDSWTGPAPMRPYKARWPEGHPVYNLPAELKGTGAVYHPFVWRGWWDFGTGVLGDSGAHAWNAVWTGLELDAPSSVEVLDASGPTAEMFPLWSVVRFDFPARGKRRPMKFFWYDGTRIDGWRKPPRELLRGESPGLNGTIIVGTKAILGRGHKAIGDYEEVERTLPRPDLPPDDAMYGGWIQGITTGSKPLCPFPYAGPLTEALLLGNIALRVGRRIEWDSAAFRVTNCEEANQYLRRQYRKGWEL